MSSDAHAVANLAGSRAAGADEIGEIEVTDRLFAEVDRQLVEVREQSTGLATRSGLLISVTAVAAAVLLANLGRVKTGDVIAFVALGVAALAGVVTVIPGLELGPRAIYLARWAIEHPPQQALTALYEAKLLTLEANHRRLAFMTWTFCLQGVAVLVAVLLALTAAARR